MLFASNLLNKFYKILKEEFPDADIKINTKGVIIEDADGFYYCTHHKDDSTEGIYVQYRINYNSHLSENKRLELLKTLNEINSDNDVTAVLFEEANTVSFVPILNLVLNNDYKDKTGELKLDYAMRSLMLLIDEVDHLKEEGFISKIKILIK